MFAKYSFVDTLVAYVDDVDTSRYYVDRFVKLSHKYAR